MYAVLYAAIFIPAIWILGEAALLRSWSAYLSDEVELMSAWGPLIWPFYSAMTLGIVALVLQTLVEVIRHVVGIFGIQHQDPEDEKLGA